MSESNNNQFEEENFLFAKNKENSFVAPEGYFDSLSARLMNKIELIQEREQYPRLSAVSPPQPSLKGGRCFVVPQNYFIKNENLLEYKYELAAFGELSKVPKPLLKPITSEYFDALSSKVLKQIELADELKNYAVLSEINKEKVFAVEADYFETLADKVKERYHSENTQKNSIVEQVFSFIFKPKMAFAYSIVLVVGIGMYFFFNQPEKVVDTGDCKTLACLERKEILNNEHAIQNLDEENLYDLVDVGQLDQQLTRSTIDSLAEHKTDSVPKN